MKGRKRMLKVYLGNGLFSEADQIYNELLASEIEKMIDIDGKPAFDLYVPQRNKDINDKTKVASSIPIYDGDMQRLRDTDILIAVLDGPVIDPGLAAEIGWFCADIEEKHPERLIVGLLTDSRDGTHTPSGPALDEKAELLNTGIGESQFSYQNLFIIGGIKKHGVILSSRKALFDFMRGQANR
jgi:hypothetical protein